MLAFIIAIGGLVRGLVRFFFQVSFVQYIREF
jgi:hypothetical protein